LPENFYQEMILQIDKIGPQDLLRIANEYFHEDSFIEIAVG
jgi:predicted Zn-dependent peptidase